MTSGSKSLGSQDLLRVTGLDIQIEDRILVQGLSFQVHAGDFFVIEGPSGRGKTTLLKMLSGESKVLDGKIDCQVPWAEIRQDLALNPELSAVENLEVVWHQNKTLCQSLKGPSPSLRSQFRQALLDWGIQDPDQNLRELSGGEKQRVAAVRVLFQDWKILLADEPTSQLDLVNSRKVLGHLKNEAQKRGGAVVTVLHHPELVAEFATQRRSLT